MDPEEQFEIAVAALRELENLHTQFMENVGALKTPEIEGARLSVVSGELRASCLGVSLSALHRPVIRDGLPRSLEYAFRARHRDQDVVVGVMYLEGNGSLYADSRAQDLICQSGNTYLTHRLAPWLSAVLLQSEIFAPIK